MALETSENKKRSSRHKMEKEDTLCDPLFRRQERNANVKSDNPEQIQTHSLSPKKQVHNPFEHQAKNIYTQKKVRFYGTFGKAGNVQVGWSSETPSLKYVERNLFS